MDEEKATATVAGCAHVFDLHALKDFAADTRVRKMLFKTDQPGRRSRATSPGNRLSCTSTPRKRKRSSCWKAPRT